MFKKTIIFIVLAAALMWLLMWLAEFDREVIIELEQKVAPTKTGEATVEIVGGRELLPIIVLVVIHLSMVFFMHLQEQDRVDRQEKQRQEDIERQEKQRQEDKEFYAELFKTLRRRR